MAVCNDRRWPEIYRVMGLQGVEMVLIGYNTPSVNAEKSEEGPEEATFHNRLSAQAGAYQNSTWVVSVAKAGVSGWPPLDRRQPDCRTRTARSLSRPGPRRTNCWFTPAISTPLSSARTRSSTSRSTAAPSITA